MISWVIDSILTPQTQKVSRVFFIMISGMAVWVMGIYGYEESKITFYSLRPQRKDIMTVWLTFFSSFHK